MGFSGARVYSVLDSCLIGLGLFRGTNIGLQWDYTGLASYIKSFVILSIGADCVRCIGGAFPRLLSSHSFDIAAFFSIHANPIYKNPSWI